MNEEQNQPQVPNFEGEEMKMPENVDMPVAVDETKSIVSGPVLAILALLLIGILGGLYYWFSYMTVSTALEAPTPVTRPTAEENNEPESTTAEAQTDTMLTTSPSDDISALEADIEATNLDSLDTELQTIDAEMDAAIE